MAKLHTVGIVGGGLAGLAAAIKLAEKGIKARLYSLQPAKRAHSVCAQGGINGAVNTKGEGDSPAQHFDDTIFGGDFLANQTLVKEMCEAGPEIIYLFDRMGVPFNRTPENFLEFRRFGGTRVHRTAHAGASTGQQLLYALDEQARRYEAEGLVERYESVTYLGPLLDDQGVTRGCLLCDVNTMEVKPFFSNALILASGGLGMIFGKSTNSLSCTGSVASSSYQAGARYANAEFIQIHPTSIPGEDKLRLISESVRGEGGRVWVYKEGKPWYFLEEKYPEYGNLVPRDIATREIFSVVYQDKLGIDNKPQVYLDVSHLPKDVLKRKLGGVLEIYETFAGEDPYKVPMRIFPGVHYTMGGLWIDQDHRTTIPNLLAAGECDYQYHGANRLGANSLLSCVFGGFRAAETAIKEISQSSPTPSEHILALGERQALEYKKKLDHLKKAQGQENPYLLWKEMGDLMMENCTIIRENSKLQKTEEKLNDLMERYQNLGAPDSSSYSNQSVIFSYDLWNMLVLARVICRSALLRNESRGAHYKPEFPERNDEKFLKTTLADYVSDWQNGPKISYEEVDTQWIKPRPRDYSSKKNV
jgi:succinate dehydrogenase / fumarate reductase flavoprotein subunit